MERNNSIIYKYLKELNENYAKVVSKKFSMTNALSNFRQISSNFSKFDSEDIPNDAYSSRNFRECNKNEQLDFYNDQLQTIECLVVNSIYEKSGIAYNWGKIFKLLNDKDYAKTEKIKRKLVFATSYNNRPIGEISYQLWNGLQIIDLDIKNAKLCDELKPRIFDELSKYHWFLGVCKSASGKGLHVWTKITPISINPENKKVEFLCNFRHKYSYVYIVLSKFANEFNYSKDDIKQYMDMAMAKPQQGIFISSDFTSYLNTNFYDTRLDVDFEQAFDNGIESINWISYPELKDIFSKLEWFNNDEMTDSSIEISSIASFDDRDASKSKGKVHYKHAQRWQLANTLNAIYGADKALEYLIDICQGTSKSELAGDIKTASIHNKPMTLWAVKELNKKHGFKIKIKTDDEIEEETRRINKSYKNFGEGSKEDDKTSDEQCSDTKERVIEDPIKALNDSVTEPYIININKTQYLSDVKDDIINHLGHITLLEAGAGIGKTEMIKALKSKTMLILPFTSTIKSKIESSETTKDWKYYYGKLKPSLDELLDPYQSMSMTIDKFSNLNIMELDQAGFEYIVIDESHLLFTSSYRDVMAPTLQRIANLKAKIILMTGTPTGELLFFPHISHIKVIKEDYRDKEFNIHMCPTKNEVLLEMAKEMTNDVLDGKKILFPTNKGNLFFEQITGLIQRMLNESNTPKQLKAFYYKKSNYGDNSMDNINIDKSIGDNDIIFCTTYLSVGVDICDKYKFSVYFDEQWIPQDIEQFANRLRNNDLYLKMFLPKRDAYGIPIKYSETQNLDLSFDVKDLLFIRDIIRACNDVLERNNEESKYNPLISSILSTNKYLKYDENDCKYYIDETAYKLQIFETRYSEFAKQLEVMKNGMKGYGYVINVINHNDEIPEANVEELENYMKSCRHIRFDYMTNETMKFLDHINDGNIDFYKDLIRGDYEIFKASKYKEVREENNLYTDDIEVLEKNIPIIVSLYKYYEIDNIKEIYKYCTDIKQNKINYSKLGRIRKFVIIEATIKKKRLDFPVHKFVQDAQKFARENPNISKTKIEEWLGIYACKYANSVKDVVVDDKRFLEEIFELIKSLWKVIIIETKDGSGNLYIKPFELLWTKRKNLSNYYGTEDTMNFFINELEGNMRDEDKIEYVELPELEMTSKKKLSDVEKDIPNIVHKDFDYFIYSEDDGSNKRFLRKQVNTDSTKDNIFKVVKPDDDTLNNVNTNKETTLFDDCPF